MAQAYTRGANIVYIQFGTATPIELGTGERAPRIAIRREWERVMNDLAGVRQEYDRSYQGSSAAVTLKLTRWNQSTLNALEDTVVFSQTPGTDDLGSMGTLINTEGANFGLYIAWIYGPGMLAANTAYNNTANGAMPPGYHFYSATLDGDAVYEGGTDPASVLLTFHCMRVYNPSTGDFTLYDRILTGLPSPT